VLLFQNALGAGKRANGRPRSHFFCRDLLVERFLQREADRSVLCEFAQSDLLWGPHPGREWSIFSS